MNTLSNLGPFTLQLLIGELGDKRGEHKRRRTSRMEGGQGFMDEDRGPPFGEGGLGEQACHCL